MTICCGWISETSAFLVTDSAMSENINEESPPTRPKTSFGEDSINGPTRARYEGLLKIMQLGSDCIGAFAGLAIPALETLGRIRERIQLGAALSCRGSTGAKTIT